MLSFYDVFYRFLEGPHISEMDYDLDFDQKLRDTVEKYGIKYDPDNPIPQDDQLADNVFLAGLEFYEKIGSYCIDTLRTARFTKKEILEAVAEAPSDPVFGKDKDAKKLTARLPESDQPPWFFIGAAGAAVTDEHVLSAIVEGYGHVPYGNSITTPSIISVNGRPIIAKTPLEVLGAIRTVEVSKAALKKAGRAGMPIMNAISTATSDAAKIAGSQFGLNPSDGLMVGSMSELKLDFQRLNEIAYALHAGSNIVAESGPLLGGYCGGPEGVAVTNVAYHLQGILVQRGTAHFTFPIHFKFSSNTSRNTIWATSISNQAISRNSKFPLLTSGILASGPGTEMCFYENAARTIATCVSGGGILAVGLAKNVKTDHLTPWDPKFSVEIAMASLGMKRDVANEMVKELLTKYEEKIPDAPVGKKFQELFNIETLEPKSEYFDLYYKMKEEMTSYGLKFTP
ncbi:MAG: monomethylamine:corrinoid methyltransferase [Deltaproteobacteria bacterium]|nr:monomethylamine:corrinoid methyltransferase [Deltaproteobacteria bacterium]